MTLIHTLIKQKSNQALAAALTGKWATWVRLHPTTNTFFNSVAGVTLYLKQQQTTLEDFKEMDAMLNKHSWFFDPMFELLEQVENSTKRIKLESTKSMNHQEANAIVVKQASFSTTPIYTDRNVVLPKKKDLERVLEEFDFTPDTWEEEVNDCDEKAGYMWGLYQRTDPGNTTVGFAMICGNKTSGKRDCHALLLALCDDEKLYWIENNGKIYPVGELAGWDNATIKINMCLF